MGVLDGIGVGASEEGGEGKRCLVGREGVGGPVEVVEAGSRGVDGDGDLGAREAAHLYFLINCKINCNRTVKVQF